MMPPRWVKATYGIQDAVGISPRVYQETGAEWILGVGYADSYIERLRLTNRVFGDEIVLHAVLANEEGTISVITSQQHRSGESTTPEFVIESMRNLGFLPLASPHAFYRASDNIAVFDLHTENVSRRVMFFAYLTLSSFSPPAF